MESLGLIVLGTELWLRGGAREPPAVEDETETDFEDNGFT